MTREEIFERINKERDRQDAKFGASRNQHPAVWNTILTEEVGEVSKEICDAGFEVKKLSDNYAEELIQVASVAIAALEDIKNYNNE